MMNIQMFTKYNQAAKAFTINLVAKITKKPPAAHSIRIVGICLR